MNPKLIADVVNKTGLDHDEFFIRDAIEKYGQQISEMTDTDLEISLAWLAHKLEEPLSGSYWIGDYHGNYKAYFELLNRRFGFIQLKVMEKLPSHSQEITDPEKLYSKEEQENIEYIIRTGKLPQNNNMSPQKILHGLQEILRARTLALGKADYIREKTPEKLSQNIRNLFHNSLSPLEENRIVNNPVIFKEYVRALARLCRNLILGDTGKQIYLGDSFDRGDDPDKLIRLFIKYRKQIKYVWGNHDILWMGAATGHRALVAEALRISFRYDQTDFITRLGINFDKLEKFVEKTYIEPDRKKEIIEIDINTKAKEQKNKYIEKALFVILTKLEHEIIKRNPAFNMGSRLYLNRLASAIKENKKEILAYNDKNEEEIFELVTLNFPTIDPENPEKLTDEEAEIINDLAEQFRVSTGLKGIERSNDPEKSEEEREKEEVEKMGMIEYLYKNGYSYYRYYNKLGVHSGIPCTEDGRLAELAVFENKKGRELFDHMETIIKKTGDQYLSDEKIAEKDTDYLYFLWCGPNSPFFDKHKMATWERYLITGTVDKNDFKKLKSIDIDALWRELIEKDYIYAEGEMTARFKNLQNASELELSASFEDKKSEIYKILHKAYLNGEKSKAGKENSLYWLKHMENPYFRAAIFQEFSDNDERIDAFIQGHTPQNHSDADNIFRADGEHLMMDSSIIKGDVGSIYGETSRNKYLIRPDIPHNDLISLDITLPMSIIVIKHINFPKQRFFKEIKESKLIRVLYELLRIEQEERLEVPLSK